MPMLIGGVVSTATFSGVILQPAGLSSAAAGPAASDAQNATIAAALRHVCGLLMTIAPSLSRRKRVSRLCNNQKMLARAHGTNAPEAIGGSVNSRCIRLVNDDVVDLYNRIALCARVVVSD